MSSPQRQKQGAIIPGDFDRFTRGVTLNSRSAKWPADTKRLVPNGWRDTERLLAYVFTNSPQAISITTLDEERYLDVNETFLSLLGYNREEVIGRTSLELGIWQTSEHRADFAKTLVSTGQIRNYETTMRGKEGQARVWLSSADLIELNGLSCMLITSSDITERKQTEEALRDVSARLIKAQEEERGRLARELHDGLSQRLALLCVDLAQFTQGNKCAESQRRLNTLSMRLQEAASDIHRVSHQLHPSKLDHLGLVPAVRSLCRELSERGLTIEFNNSSPPHAFENLDKEISLCAYRVIQEALTNVHKHANASAARVELKRTSNELRFNITDSGIGFNPEEARLKGRLGLISMQERLRLVDGELVVRSKRMRGTQIEGIIPIKPEDTL
jgi:PAS domain S-box-containing protein